MKLPTVLHRFFTIFNTSKVEPIKQLTCPKHNIKISYTGVEIIKPAWFGLVELRNKILCLSFLKLRSSICANQIYLYFHDTVFRASIAVLNSLKFKLCILLPRSSTSYEHLHSKKCLIWTEPSD